MVYVKDEGLHWKVFYAIDPHNKKVSVVEARYSLGEDKTVDTYLLATYSADRGTFDSLATEILMTYERITEKQWKEVKKSVADYLKQSEMFL